MKTVQWKCAPIFEALGALGYRVVRTKEWFVKAPKKSKETFKAAVAADRLWYFEVPCRRGGRVAGQRPHVYVQGPDTLAFTGSSRKVRRELLAIPGVCKHQTGDEEFSVVFPAGLMGRVAEVVRPVFKRGSKTRVNERSTGQGCDATPKNEIGYTP